MKRKNFIYCLLVTALLVATATSCKEKETITDIKLDKEELILAIGNTATLSASLLPLSASDKMSWSSSDNNVATVKSNSGEVTVSQATVTAKSAGTAIITVATKDGKHKATCTVTVINAEPELILVETGTFDMGCTDGECDENSNELPVHKVTLSNYKIAKYTITQLQWKAVMGNNPSYTKGDDLPVEQVSWNNVQEFINKLNTITGKNYRLPTEAEWEFAARGGNKSKGYKYSGSNTINDVAWYSVNSGRKLQPVGTKAPNELGIYDMSGNVFEWCSDWNSAYTEVSQTNPTGPATGTMHIVRGGSYIGNAYYCRISFRDGLFSNDSGIGLGFRLVHQ